MALARPVHAQSSPAASGRADSAAAVAPATAVSIFFEDDVVFRPTNADRNYTVGVGLQLSGPKAERWNHAIRLGRLRRLLSPVRRQQDAQEAADRFAHSATLSLTAFTPDSLELFGPIVGDRPYASLLALSAAHVSVDPDDEHAAWTTQATVGVLGLNLARNVQRFAHKMYRAAVDDSSPVDPKGWSNQVSNGGEPTALYSVGYERLLLGGLVTGDARNRPVSFQLTAGAQAMAGYYTEVGGSTTVRFGQLQREFWEWRSNPMGNVTKAAQTRPARPFEWFLFAAVRPRVIGYNALLQGQFTQRDNPTLFTSAEISRVVTEFDVGGSVGFDFLCRRMSVTYLVAGRTQEFEGPQARTHSWGSLFLTF